jgi:hypothetical protein
VTLTGPVEQIAEQLWLRGNADRPAVRLAPLDASNKVQCDFATKAPLPLEPEEASAHARLKRAIAGQAAPISGTVTGTVSKDDHGLSGGARFHVMKRASCVERSSHARNVMAASPRITHPDGDRAEAS